MSVLLLWLLLKDSVSSPYLYTKFVTNERFECCFSATRPTLWLLDIPRKSLTTLSPTLSAQIISFCCAIHRTTKGFNRQQLESPFRSNVLLCCLWLKAFLTIDSCLPKQWVYFTGLASAKRTRNYGIFSTSWALMKCRVPS